MSVEAQSLDRIERWMQAIVMHPDGVRAALKANTGRELIPGDLRSLEQVVLPSKNLSSVERLSIYANMYFWRLLEVMGNEYPTVRHLVGAERFQKLINDYVTRHPSRHYSLNSLSLEFPGWLARECFKFHHRGFAAALAAVERAMEEVFDEPSVEPLAFEALQAVAPESWVSARFQTVPALRLLELEYPVNEYMTAVREERKARVPKPMPTRVAVYRANFKAWRMDLSPERYLLLRSLQEGKTLGEALETCSLIPGVNIEELIGSIGKWFEDWTQEQLFHVIVFDSPLN